MKSVGNYSNWRPFGWHSYCIISPLWGWDLTADFRVVIEVPPAAHVQPSILSALPSQRPDNAVSPLPSSSSAHHTDPQVASLRSSNELWWVLRVKRTTSAHSSRTFPTIRKRWRRFGFQMRRLSDLDESLLSRKKEVSYIKFINKEAKGKKRQLTSQECMLWSYCTVKLYVSVCFCSNF